MRKETLRLAGPKMCILCQLQRDRETQLTSLSQQIYTSSIHVCFTKQKVNWSQGFSVKITINGKKIKSQSRWDSGTSWVPVIVKVWLAWAFHNNTTTDFTDYSIRIHSHIDRQALKTRKHKDNIKRKIKIKLFSATGSKEVNGLFHWIII